MIYKVNLSTASEIIVEKRGSKRVVTLNRPKALNALNLTMVRELNPKLAVRWIPFFIDSVFSNGIMLQIST